MRQVVVEFEIELEAGLQPGVGVEELAHLLRVAGHDDGKVVAAVGHFLDQNLDDFAAEVFGIFGRTGQGIGFVDEQDPAPRFLNGFLHFGGGLADVFAHQVHPIHFVDVAAAEQAHFAVELAHHLGHGGLARAGVPDEHTVDVDFLLFVEAGLLAQLKELNVLGVVAYLFFDFLQTDQLIQAGDDVFEGLVRVVFQGGGQVGIAPRDEYLRKALLEFVAHFEVYHRQQAVHEHYLAGVLAFPPGAGRVGPPTGAQGEQFLVFANLLQPHHLPLQLARLVEEFDEQLALPIPDVHHVAQGDLRIDVAGGVGFEPAVKEAVFFGQVVVGALVQFQPPHLEHFLGAEHIVEFGLLDVEKFGGHLFPLDPGFPAVGAGLPEGAFRLVPPPFPDELDVVELADLLAQGQGAQAAPAVADGVAAQLHVHLPVLDVEQLVVKGKLGVDVGHALPVEHLAVLLAVVRQPFGAGIDLQRPELVRLEVELDGSRCHKLTAEVLIHASRSRPKYNLPTQLRPSRTREFRISPQRRSFP